MRTDMRNATTRPTATKRYGLTNARGWSPVLTLEGCLFLGERRDTARDRIGSDSEDAGEDRAPADLDDETADLRDRRAGEREGEDVQRTGHERRGGQVGRAEEHRYRPRRGALAQSDGRARDRATTGVL